MDGDGRGRMTMRTEDEAKERWCPFVRFTAAGDDAAANRWVEPKMRSALNPVSCRCIASQCMAWRWANEPDGEPAYKRTSVKDTPGHHDNAPLGYCGLAGTPDAPAHE